MGKRLLIAALALVALGWVVLGGLWLALQWVEVPEASAMPNGIIVEATNAEVLIVTQTPTPFQVIVETDQQTPTPSPTSTPEPTPTITPRVIDYRFDGVIDLSSGLPVAMIIYTTDGRVVKSNWAKAIAYADGDDEGVFAPYAGTVYSHEDGGFVATWIHSGYLKNGNQLFGYPLEKEVWRDEDNQVIDWSEGFQKATDLIGAKVVICQAPADSKILPFSNYDEVVGCPGAQLEFVIEAASLVEHEKVESYEASVGSVIEWMKQNYPGQGFELLESRSSYLVQTCVGRYKDQKSDGSSDFVFNRLIIGMTLRE